MRILFKSLGRLVNAYKLQKLLSALICLFFVFIRMQPYNLCYLVAYCVNGIKARHRVLKYYGNLVSSYLSEILIGHLFNFVTVKSDCSAYKLARVCGKPHY